MIGTKIILEDQSYIPSLKVADPRTTPIIFMGFTSDKGTEEYKKWQGKEFFAQYGEISFARHGHHYFKLLTLSIMVVSFMLNVLLILQQK